MCADLLLVLLALLPIIYFSTFCHELGHAVMAWLGGGTVTSFGMGLDRPVWVADWGGTRVFFCRSGWLSGFTFALFPQLFPSTSQLVAYSAGGILANASLALLGLLLWWTVPWGAGFWLVLAGYNGLLVFANLIPATVWVGKAEAHSDGAEIWRLLRTGGFNASIVERIYTLKGLRNLLEAVGDRRALSIYALRAAGAWLELGNAGEAERLCQEAHQFGGIEAGVWSSHAAYVRGRVAYGLGNKEEAARLFDEAESGFSRLNHPAGLFLVTLMRSTLFWQENPDEVREALELLTNDPLTRVRPALRLALVTMRLEMAVTGDQDVGGLQAEYENLRRRCPSSVGDLQVYAVLAGWHDRHDRWGPAAACYDRALEAARAIREALSDRHDRELFHEGQSELYAKAEACYERLEQTGAAKPAPLGLPSEELTPEQQRIQEQERRNRRRYEASALWAAVALILALGFIVAAVEPTRPSRRSLDLLLGGLVLLPFSAATFLGGLLCLGLGPFVPFLRRSGGKWLQGLVVLLWLGVLIFLLMYGAKWGLGWATL
jgi:hypothetical protein